MRWAALAFFVAAIIAGLVDDRSHAKAISAASSSLPSHTTMSEGGTRTRPSVSVPAGTHVLPLGAGVASDAMAIPVAGIRREQLHSMFNDGRAGHIHHAIDILAPRGTPVVATVDGRIRKLFSSGAGGLTIYESDPAEEKIYYYAHLDHYAAATREGLDVKRGEVIGYVGTTGNAPPGTPHLHFAVFVLPPTKEWWKGDAVDPYPMLVRDGVTVAVAP